MPGIKKTGAPLVLLLLCTLMSLNTPVCAQDAAQGGEQRLMRVEEKGEGLASVAGTWNEMLRFDTTASYQYALTRWKDDIPVIGSLSIQTIEMPSGVALSLSYEIDGQRDGLHARPLASTPAEALMASLLASSRWSLEDIQLLWTPFAFIPWATHLVGMPWRSGEGWTVRSLGNESFRVEEVARDEDGCTIYRGHLQRYGQTVLTLEINLDLPLPTYVQWVDASGTHYEARIKKPE